MAFIAHVDMLLDTLMMNAIHCPQGMRLIRCWPAHYEFNSWLSGHLFETLVATVMHHEWNPWLSGHLFETS